MLTGVATLQSNPLPLRDGDLLRTRAYVDGSWVEGDSGESFPVVDPATGATIAEVPRLGAAETRRRSRRRSARCPPGAERPPGSAPASSAASPT